MAQSPGPVVDPRGAGPNDLLLPTEALSGSFDRALEDVDWVSQESGAKVSGGRRGFRIGSIGLVPAAGVLCEIIERPRTFPIPNTADCCLGMINLRGMLIPAFRVHPLLGTHDAAVPARWFVVVGEGAQAGALSIDGLPVQVDLPPESQIAAIPPLPDVLGAHVLGGYQFQGELWFEFDYAGFLGTIAER